MKFFNVDLHIGVISDIKSMLGALGHEVVDLTLSAHAWVLGRQRDDVKVINHENWRDIDQGMADRFYSAYKEELSDYDGFIVTHTPCFALLFEKWQKPIITVASTRYEHPFSANLEKWHYFNEFLQRSIDSGLVVPIANNAYDARYAELYTHRPWTLISSICDYTGISYAPTTDLHLVFSKSPVPIPSRKFQSRDQLKPSRIRRLLNKVPGIPRKDGFSWSEVGRYKGIVHFPYNASIMSIFEHYYGNIPMFFPSESYALSLFEQAQFGVFSELSFNQVNKLPTGSALAVPQPDPNDYKNVDMLSSWISLSDFYDPDILSNIQYFQSLDHLSEMINTVDYERVSEEMSAHNLLRRERSLAAWQKVIESIA